MTGQLLRALTLPSGAPPGAVSGSGRVLARVRIWNSSACRVSSPSLTAFLVHSPNRAYHREL